MKRLTILLTAALLGGAAVFSQQKALVRLSVVSMRASAAHSAEQVSQALMGTEVEVLERGKSWSRVRTPDGYEGWIINHSLNFDNAPRWAKGEKVMFAGPWEMHDADRRTDLVAGDLLLVAGDSLELPDGRKISAQGLPLCPWPVEDPFDGTQLPLFAAQYLGVPYVWGGLSSKGMDCSGLVRMAFMAQGRTLPRDAWQQAQCGREVPADSLQPGDLLFFGRNRVTHVAIYEGNGLYIHASEMVRRNSLDPSSPLYLLLPPTLHRRRL